MLETILYIWLAGALGVGGYKAVKCHEDTPRPISKGECYALSAMSGIVWPVIIISECQK